MTKYKTKKKYGRCKQWLLEKLFFGNRYNVNSMKYFDHIDYYVNGRYFLFNIRISWNYFGLFSVQSLEMRSFNRNLMSQSFEFRDRIFILKLSTSKFDYSSILNAIVTLWSILVQSNFILLQFFGRNVPTYCLNMPWRLSNYTQVIFAIWCSKSFQLV